MQWQKPKREKTVRSDITSLNLFTFGAAMSLLAASPGPGVFATLARALASERNQTRLNRCAGSVMVTAGGAILMKP